MWRFILISFAFLGWSFYELSGGADYAPDSASLQVAGAKTPLFARPTPVAPKQPEIQMANAGDLPPPIKPLTKSAPPVEHYGAYDSDDETVSRAAASLASLSDGSLDRFSITLASTLPDESGIIDLGLEGISGFSSESLVDAVNGMAVSDPVQSTPSLPADIRSISGNAANLRTGPGTQYDKVDQLTQGEPVEILERTADGWVHLRALETGSEGWMAEWLVTSAN